MARACASQGMLVLDTKAIVTGALVAQLVIAVISFVGGHMLREAFPRAYLDDSSVDGSRLIALLLIFSLGPLVATAEMSTMWMNLFPNSAFAGISRDSAMAVAFVIDILVAAQLIWRTGGSVASPFQPILFLIPALALLLYEPTWRVWLYTGLVTCVFFACLNADEFRVSRPFWVKSAFAFVTVASLLLTIITGLLTRACPTLIC